jgi:hypothetical protein
MSNDITTMSVTVEIRQMTEAARVDNKQIMDDATRLNFIELF